MKIVWSVPSAKDVDVAATSLAGCYQDMLRSVGAWLDARSYRLSSLTVFGDSFVIEVETGQPGDDLSREAFRLEYDALSRLMHAARADRNRFSAAS